eukprot:scaffold92765_cov67-Cyclotella_meneghiniana.AAC.1
MTPPHITPPPTDNGRLAHVVMVSSSNNNNEILPVVKSSERKNLEARIIKLLPEGSVKFEHVLAEGVTGVVLECPIERAMEGFGRSGSGGGGIKKQVRQDSS